MSTLFSLILVGISLGQTPQPVQPFPDVPKTHWAYAAVTELHAKGILKGYPSAYARTTPYAALKSLLKAINNGDEASIRELTTSQWQKRWLEHSQTSSLTSSKRMAALKQASLGWRMWAMIFTTEEWETFNAKATTVPMGTETEVRHFKGHDLIFRFVQDPSGWKVAEITSDW